MRNRASDRARMPGQLRGQSSFRLPLSRIRFALVGEADNKQKQSDQSDPKYPGYDDLRRHQLCRIVLVIVHF